MQSSRMVWGGLLIVLGLVLLGGNVFDFNALVTIWKLSPLVLIGFGGWIFVKHPQSRVVASLVSLFGLLLFLGNLGIINANIFNLWPLILIAIGVNVLFKGDNATSLADDTEALTDTTLFASSKKVINSDKFKSAKLTVLFGSSELDLRGANLKGDVVVESVVLFGEVKIKLPDNVAVINQTTNILAEVKNQRSSREKSSVNKVNVVVKGFAAFGEVEIE